MLRFFATLLAIACLVTPAQAGMSIASLSIHRQTALATNVLTTAGSDCPVGSLIVVYTAYLTVVDTLSSVTDSAGNTYQAPFDNIAGTLVGVGWAYAKSSTVDLPIGGTITATFAGAETSKVGALCISASHPASPLDTSNHTDNGVAATASANVNTGTLTNATEVVIGLLALASTTATANCNGSYALALASIANSPSLQVCTQAVASTASVGFAPTWSDANNYVTDLVSFQGVSPTLPAISMTGVGP